MKNYENTIKIVETLKEQEIYGDYGNTKLFGIKGLYGRIKKEENGTFTIMYATDSVVQSNINDELSGNKGEISATFLSSDDMGYSYIKDISDIKQLEEIYNIMSDLVNEKENKKTSANKVTKPVTKSKPIS
jgi:hypothetical protein